MIYERHTEAFSGALTLKGGTVRRCQGKPERTYFVVVVAQRKQ